MPRQENRASERGFSFGKGRPVHQLGKALPLARGRFFIQAYLERDMIWQRPKRKCRLDQRGSRSLLEKYHERHTLREIGRLRRNCGGRG